jgi:hypothetical protein
MRIIYRLVEFSQGTTSTNPILTHEGYTYGLDALPMFLAVVILNVIHPGWILKGSESEFPRQTRKEKKAVKKQKKEAKQQEKHDEKLAKEARKQEKLDRKLGRDPRAVAPTGNHSGQQAYATYTVGEYQDFDDDRSRVLEV